MKLENFQKPTYIPGWLEKNLYIQQKEKLPVYEKIADVAKTFYVEQDCRTIVDLGCWLGCFSLNLKKKCNPEKLTIVDACPTYLWMAKQLLTDQGQTDNVELVEMTISDTPVTHFVVDIDRTIGSSSVFSKLREGVISFNMPVVSATSPAEAAVKVFEMAGSNCYMKIDIDGMDYNLLNEMMSINFFPRVLHFESFLYNKDEIIKCLNILDYLSNVGFKTPKPSEILDKKIADIIVSRSRYHVIGG